MEGVQLYRNMLPESLFGVLEQKLWNMPTEIATRAADTSWVDLRHPTNSVVHRVVMYLRSKLTLPPEVVGAEWWVRKVPVDTIGGWHFDKDERHALHTGEFRHPNFASVMYFGTDGGPTVVSNEIAKWEGDVCATLGGDPIHGVAVYPTRNQYFLFPGLFHHCVEAAAPGSDGERLTLLVNWWMSPPVLLPVGEELEAYLQVEDVPLDNEPDRRKEDPIFLDSSHFS